MPRLNASGWKKGDLRIWSGELDNIPNGWELASEMIDRALVGAGGVYAKNQKFGLDSRTPAKPSVTVSVQNHTLSTARTPVHKHKETGLNNYTNRADGYSGATAQRAAGSLAGVTIVDTGMQSVGSSQAHAHGASVSVGNVGAVDTRQLSIAVIWIRKL